MAEQTRDLYAVARGTEVLTDRRTSVEQVKHDLSFIETSMRNAGLEPDVQIVQVTETTTYSDPVPYTPPAPVAVDEPVTEDALAEQAPAETGEHADAEGDDEDDDLEGLR
jgi:hypothetical protein